MNHHFTLSTYNYLSQQIIKFSGGMVVHVGRKQIGMIIGIVELLDCCQQDVISLKKIGGQLLCRSFFQNLNVKDCKYR